jgi:hypothetical protein
MWCCRRQTSIGLAPEVSRGRIAGGGQGCGTLCLGCKTEWKLYCCTTALLDPTWHVRGAGKFVEGSAVTIICCLLCRQ